MKIKSKKIIKSGAFSMVGRGRKAIFFLLGFRDKNRYFSKISHSSICERLGSQYPHFDLLDNNFYGKVQEK